ncbi:MAG: zinc-ribbon protein, partial [Chloroflexi bacterium]|nr:zinc-ribbon protein [Chloroflexota bacterium]
VILALVDEGPVLIDRFVPGGALLRRAQSGAPGQAARLAELLKRRAISPTGGNIQQTDLFEQFTKLMQALARKHPLLLFADDLQWADSGSINLLFHLGRQLTGHRILLIGAYRPGDVSLGRDGDRHPLEPIVNELQRQYGDVRLDLSQVEGHDFVDAFLDTEPNRLGNEFRQALFRLTGGHPLFVVELIRGLQERGDLIKDESGCWIAGRSLDWEILPPRVEAVIAESIGRLPETMQTVLDIASVEGEVFTAQAISYIQIIDHAEVIRLLSGPLSKLHQLVIALGVQRLGESRIASYRFRHFLFQKYLYSRLDEVERAHLHEAMGNALEVLYGEQSHIIALQLARHFEISGLITPAVKYLHLAGDNATRLYANAEAIHHYHHALDLLQTSPETPERNILELRLRVALGVPLLATRGFSDLEVGQNFERAHELAREVETSAELFQVLSGLKNYYDLRLSLRTALELAEDMLSLAERLQDRMLQQFACHQMSTTLLYMGRLRDSLEFRRRASELYDREVFRTIIFQLGFDPESAGLSHASWAYWLLGYPEQAKRLSQEALAWSEELGHPFMIGFSKVFAGQMHCYLRDVPMTRKLANETIKLSQELGMTFWLAAADCLIGWVLAEEGRMVEAMPQQQQAMTTLSMIGAELGRIQTVPLAAELTGACYQQSIESARAIEAKSWELRASLSQCRLWQRQGKAKEAYTQLSSIYNWFTEGFDTPDLIEARQLLVELVSH